MEIENMSMEQIEERISQISTELESDSADIEALSAEVDKLEARKAELKQIAETRKATLEKVASMKTQVLDKIEERKEPENMNEEKRAQLVDALAEYIKGNATSEQRALLTTQVSGGTVRVSDIVDDYVWTDWDKNPILSRIRKVYVKGTYKVGYEASATGAVKHTEGDETAPAEEVLTLGYVDFVAQYFKKWIKVSDTVLALKGQAFMDYLFDEFGYQIAKALENEIVAEIVASTLSAKVTHAIDNTAPMAGFAALSDEATNPVVIISKTTYAAIMNERATTGAKIEDPFNGMEVLFNNTVTGMLVGDLDGVVANFPEGEDFKFIVDETSLAEHDLVKIVGKVLASIHLVRPNGFAVVTAA